MARISARQQERRTTRGPFTRKPLELVLQELIRSSEITRQHFGLWDLVSIGVGGTVGSGIFVLAGWIAHDFAGPSTCLSFLWSGVAALCSGLCYAEWASRLPAAGSTYVYSLVSLGELSAVIAGACLTLEYGVSGAAVARSWGDKVLEWLRVDGAWEETSSSASSSWNPLAGFISLLAVLLLSVGVQESKNVTNFFTVLKVGLVGFMIVGGFCLWDSSNLLPSFAPYGVAGTLRGATSSFFAYLGYDEVCCLAAEARNPTKDLPRAVLLTIAIVTALYVLASLALVGMVPFQDISETSGFPAAFATRGIGWASQLVAAGEVITLPVVVLISLMAQPRLFAAMASDGLMPHVFQQRNEQDSNLLFSNLLCGIPMSLLATFVPFSHLNDCISVGILVAFNLTNTSLILMKCNDYSDFRNTGRSNSSRTATTTGCPVGPVLSFFRLSRHLALFHVVALASALAPRVIMGDGAEKSWSLILLGLLVPVLYALYIHSQSSMQPYFGSHLTTAEISSPSVPSTFAYNSATFETPMVPFIPLVGVVINSFLIAQLEWSGLALLLLYLTTVSFLYGVYHFRTNQVSWEHCYDSLGQTTSSDDEADDSAGAAILMMEVLDHRPRGGGGGATTTKTTSTTAFIPPAITPRSIVMEDCASSAPIL